MLETILAISGKPGLYKFDCRNAGRGEETYAGFCYR